MKEIQEIILSYGKIGFWYNEFRRAEKQGNMTNLSIACKKWKYAQKEHKHICEKYSHIAYYDELENL